MGAGLHYRVYRNRLIVPARTTPAHYCIDSGELYIVGWQTWSDMTLLVSKLV